MSLEVGAEGPGGGLVFWSNLDDRSLPRALEAAPRGWYRGGTYPSGGEAGDDCRMIWSPTDDGLDSIRMNAKEVGKGKENLVGIGSSGVWHVPQLQIKSYLGADWMLPTIDELQLMYERLHLHGLGDFDGEQYWSCSTFSAQYIYSWNFVQGEQMMSFHDMCFSLRPVRQIDWD